MTDKLTLRNIYRAGDDVALAWFQSARWGDEVTCPSCGGLEHYKLAKRKIFKCKNPKCHKQFSVYSDTAISAKKMRHSDMLACMFLFSTGAAGVSAMQLSRMTGLSYNSVFTLCHKFREAIQSEMLSLTLDGTVEIDGGTFGGHRKYFNHGPRPKDRNAGKSRRYLLKSKNRRVIVVAHQRMGRTIVFAGERESDAIEGIVNSVAETSTIQADGAHAWDCLERLYYTLRINHKYSFSSNGACTNNAESFFSQFRRMHRGTHKQMSGDLMIAYAAEMAWRLDMRDLTHEERVLRLARTVLTAKKSDRWNGYLSKKKSPEQEAA